MSWLRLPVLATGVPASPQPGNPPASKSKVGVDFIDILFGFVVSDGFKDLLSLDRHDAVRWSHVIVALWLVALSWIGYHKAKDLSRRDLNFKDLSVVQFLVDVGIVALYFFLVRAADQTRHHLTVVPEVWFIAGIFGAYLLWDLLDIGLDSANATHRALGSGIWATLFLIAALVLGLGWDPSTTVPVVVVDAAYVVMLYLYRVRQESHLS